MITADGITKAFGEVLAVNNVSFSIKDGEITGLLGRNGAGKTTTLRMLTSYLKADSGEITVGDYRVNQHPVEIRRMIGYLPETAPFYADLLVYDYLAYVAEMRGIEANGRMRKIADICGINEVMHKNIGELSKGYKQRVGLANAMIHDPDILILDEPTSGLDPTQIVEIRNLIREIGKKKTVIISTHILSEVEVTCDRVIIIDNGAIVTDDRTENLRSAAGGEKTIALTVDGVDFDTLSGELKSLQGITGVSHLPELEHTTVTVSSGGDRDIRPDIFTLVRDRGWTLYELKQEQKSLEWIFRELTTGGEYE